MIVYFLVIELYLTSSVTLSEIYDNTANFIPDTYQRYSDYLFLMTTP